MTNSDQANSTRCSSQTSASADPIATVAIELRTPRRAGGSRQSGRCGRDQPRRATDVGKSTDGRRPVPFARIALRADRRVARDGRHLRGRRCPASSCRVGTLQTIFGSQSALLFLAIAGLCTFVVGEFDLSFASGHGTVRDDHPGAATHCTT